MALSTSFWLQIHSSIVNPHIYLRTYLDKEGIQLLKKKSPDGGVNIVKRYVEIDAPLDTVADIATAPETLLKINDKLKTNEIVKEWSDTAKLIRREMKGNLVVSNRDICLFWHRINLTDGSKANIMYSIEHELMPVTKCVRAEVDFACIVFQKVSETTTS